MDDDQQDPVIDRVTRELRRAFQLVNKKAERMEREASELVKKQAAAARRAERRANRPPADVRLKLRIARKEAIAMLDKPICLEYRCLECGAVLEALGEEEPGQLCAPCLSRLRQLIPGLRSENSTEFSEISIVPGGAPGGGKRR